ncbi:MAG: bifunctional diaminohydroxyphosphoribosylaminopyrimidine deaminase/5-amino-6-(5-phosphoribosylamino)uracil reductase RibD, partial [Elusimicrobia bacterium]|nr:bifunctional diaminohydroxyphosphoribosylaminopyrimidine deaminase/5-amino-6-(5-phosphoribosylamino)uracil reductase RibD [Elusimicrobiota bacterium]
SARQPVPGADLYVTLEPCNHHGKTPPCTDAIIKAGIKKVYTAMKDPNPLAAGKGLTRLTQHQIPVLCGIMEKQAKELNRDYLHFIVTKRPYVILKWAMSADGKIATKTGDARWISNEQARRFTHQLRADAGAIVIGINTVLQDDPSLTVRGIPGAKKPVRVILDHHLRIPGSAKVLDHQAISVVVCGEHCARKRARQLMIKGVEVMRVKTLKELLGKLADRGVAKVLVEGGGEVHASFIEQRLADQVLVVMAPLIIGGRQAITPVSGQGISKIKDAVKLHNIKITTIGDNLIMQGEL